MNDRLNGMSQTSCILEERLRRTKMEIHVQADGQVILVIGDVKGNDLLLLSLGIFDKREHETAVCLFIADSVGASKSHALASISLMPR